MDKLKQQVIYWVKSSLPYIGIFVATLMACAIYFMPGLSGGDDQAAHLAYIQDLIFGLKHGFTGLSIGHRIMGIFGYNYQTFYAPFPQYFAAIVGVMFEYAGVTVLEAIKITNIFFIFVSSVYAYLLAKRITNSRPLATVFGIAFVFFPYRLYCVFYRAALSESIAIAFIPIIFYAAYRILHDEKPKVAPFVNMVIGVAGLVLSHPFTALITATVLVVYILACLPRCLAALKRIETYIYSAISLVLILGLVAFWVFPMLSALNSGYYRVSDDLVMWMNQEHMEWSTGSSLSFGGLINYDWLVEFREDYGWTNTADTTAKWTMEIIFLVVSSALGVALREVGRRRKWNTTLVNLGVGVLLFVPMLFYWPRIEVAMALVLYFAMLLLFDIDPSMKEEVLPLREAVKSTALTTEIYGAVAPFIFYLIFVLSPRAWDWMPSIFYTGQFAWRAWSVVGISGFLIAVGISKLAKGRKVLIDVLAFGAILLFALNQASIDKRIAYANNGFVYSYYNDESLDQVYSVGAQNEYSPLIFYDTEFVSEYPNSLYRQVRVSLVYRNRAFPRDIENYIGPAFLEGTGTMQILELNTPDASFDLTITSEEAYIQFAQFYYEGYEITLSSEAGEQKIVPVYQDGLLAFRASQGTYKAELRYIGNKGYRVGRPFFYISIVGVVGLGVGGYFWGKRKEKKELQGEEA